VPLILDGNRVRDQIKAECLPRVERLVSHAGRPPGLAVVLVGNNPASEVYVRNKTKTARDLGMHSETVTPSAEMTTGQLLDLVRELNARPEIDGILVQLPLPGHIDSQCVLLAVAPEKDVDGFHPFNVGLLSTGRPGLRRKRLLLMAGKPRGAGRGRGGRERTELVEPPVALVDPAVDLVDLAGPVELKEPLAPRRAAAAAAPAPKTNPGTVFLRSQAARSKARSVQIAPATAFCASRV